MIDSNFCSNFIIPLGFYISLRTTNVVICYILYVEELRFFISAKGITYKHKYEIKSETNIESQIPIN